MQKLIFIISHYLSLIIFLFSSWGIGSAVISLFEDSKKCRDGLDNALTLVWGIGVTICFIQVLAIFSSLSSTYLIILLLVGIVLALKNTYSFFKSTNKFRLSKFSQIEVILLLILISFVLPTIFKPLRPPISWDEVMYHLPNASYWALGGKLTVNEWLRYPFFPFNFELLYSGAIILVDDVMPHMIHAAAGWITAYLIYSVSKKYLNLWIATLATIIWLWLARGYFDNAYIDMGLTLFIFSASISFYSWLEKRDVSWLYSAGFFMGVAVGSKKQALIFMPPFFLSLILIEKDWKVFLKTVCWFLVPCIYWYTRNIVLTGDPFNPIGGKIFGFSDWNLEDFKYQFADLERAKGWPNWLLWTAPLCLLRREFVKSLSSVNAIWIFVSYSFIAWLIASHYPRYLLPIYPLLAILAAAGWIFLFQALAASISRLSNKSLSELISNKRIVLVLSILLTISVLYGLVRSVTALKLVASNQNERIKILSKKISGFKVINYQNMYLSGKTYQFGLEDSIYYMRNQTWGDHFGPGRYRDFAKFNPKQLNLKLKTLGFENLLIHTTRWPEIDSSIDFKCYFEKKYSDGVVNLYKIRNMSEC